MPKHKKPKDPHARREAERWIAAGRVQVNGEVASSPRRPVDPARDVLLVDGLRVGAELDRLVLAFVAAEHLKALRDIPEFAWSFEPLRNQSAVVQRFSNSPALS